MKKSTNRYGGKKSLAIHCSFALVFALLLTGMAMFSTEASAEGDVFDFNLKPKFVTGDSFNDFAIGASYDAVYRKVVFKDTDSGDLDMIFQAKAEGTVISDEDLNNESLITQLNGGLSFLTGQAVVDDLSMETDTTPLPEDVGDWGYIDMLATIRHETDQSFKEQNFTIGGEVGYYNIKVEGIRSFIPSVVAGYDYVHPVKSHLRDDLGISKSGDSRFRIEASLKCWIGQFLAIKSLKPLHLHFDFRHYRSNSLEPELDQRALDEATYASAALSYKTDRGSGLLGGITYFLKFAEGRIPPDTEDDSILSLGIIVPLAQ